jgi:hypothetical protein
MTVESAPTDEDPTVQTGWSWRSLQTYWHNRG